ncbi:MAG: GIY-YIG nuclease family protein [Candidatus Omnitrophota bacterium]
MFYVYVLKSLKNGKRYTGFTRQSLNERLKEHNSGTNRYTRNNRPFEILHYEYFDSEILARKREKFLKSGRGRVLLEKIYEKNLFPLSSAGRASGC